MASKFFRGFSKVFKGPSNKSGFSSPTKYATIGGVKPKAKISDATKKFKSKIKETKKAIKKGTDDFKKENPKRNVTDDQIKTIQREQTEKSNKKSRKEFLREKKAVGGIAGLGKRMGKKDRKIADPQRQPKFDPSGYKFPDGVILMIPDGKGGTKTMKIPREKKAFGGLLGKKKKSVKPKKPNPDSIKQKILPKKKKDRLDELRKDLGLKEGGSALKPVDKEKNPGLSKLPTQVRNKMGYMKKGGAVKQMVKTVTSPTTHLRNVLKSRKFGQGKGKGKK